MKCWWCGEEIAPGYDMPLSNTDAYSNDSEALQRHAKERHYPKGYNMPAPKVEIRRKPSGKTGSI